jgi:hypothetical protein
MDEVHGQWGAVENCPRGHFSTFCGGECVELLHIRLPTVDILDPQLCGPVQFTSSIFH